MSNNIDKAKMVERLENELGYTLSVDIDKIEVWRKIIKLINSGEFDYCKQKDLEFILEIQQLIKNNGSNDMHEQGKFIQAQQMIKDWIKELR